MLWTTTIDDAMKWLKYTQREVLFRECVLITLGYNDTDNTCSRQKEEQCKLEYGEHFDWTCKACKLRSTKHG